MAKKDDDPRSILNRMLVSIDRLGELRNLFADEVRKDLRSDLRKLGSAILPPQDTGGSPPGMKPCWKWSHDVYLWGLRTLPLGKHTYEAIYQAAIKNGWARRVRLPANWKTFAHYIRLYRRKADLPRHRAMRRNGVA